MTEKQIKDLVKRLESPLSILVLTAFAYSLAFEYEAGYLAHFGVPQEFAEVNLQSLLVCASVVIVGAAIAAGCAYLLLELRPQSMPADRRSEVALIVWLFLVAFVLAVVLPFPLIVLLIGVFILPLVLTWAVFIQPIFSQRSVRGYWAKLEAADKARREEIASNPNQATKMSPRLRYLLLGALFLCGTPFLVRQIGGAVARHQETFLIPRGEHCVVLRARTEGLLCATYDFYKHQACGEYRFLKPEAVKLELQFLNTLEEAHSKISYWPFERDHPGPVECGEGATAPPVSSGGPPA